MQNNKMHIPSLFILITLIVSVFVLFLLSLFMGGMSAIDLYNAEDNAATEMISGVVFGFEGLLVLACAWFVLQKTMKREQADAPFHFAYAGWQIPAILTFVIFIIMLGGAIAYQEITWLSWLILPVCTVLVITPPIWLIIGIGSKGIRFGPRWRVFSVLGLGMTLGPFIMVVLEFVLLIFIILAATIYIAVLQPELLKELTDLMPLLENETNQDAILQLISPYLANPAVIATALVYLAVCVPLIEEAFKPLAVWLFIKKIESPAQGFVMGLLSGAAFALFESLNASADGSASWSFVVSVRAGTSLLHITASGLVGWGIASAFHEKKIVRFVAAYLSSVMIHGLWNACALAAGLSSIGNMIGKPQWIFAIIPAAISGMFVLGVGMLIVLIAANRKLTTPLRGLQGAE